MDRWQGYTVERDINMLMNGQYLGIWNETVTAQGPQLALAGDTAKPRKPSASITSNPVE
jgi:hypothetical protein